MAAKRSLARVAGLDVDLLSRLESNNFRTCEDVLTRHPFDLVELLDVNLPVAEKIVTCVARACCPKPVTAKQLLDSRTDDPHGDDDGSSGGGGGSSASSTRKTTAPSTGKTSTRFRTKTVAPRRTPTAIRCPTRRTRAR